MSSFISLLLGAFQNLIDISIGCGGISLRLFVRIGLQAVIHLGCARIFELQIVTTRQRNAVSSAIPYKFSAKT